MSVRVTIREKDYGLGNLFASLKAMEGDKTALWLGVQYPNRTYANGSTVGVVGLAHEFGTAASKPPTTSKRWLRGTFERNLNKYDRIIRAELGRAFDRGKVVSTRSVFLQLGPIVKKDLQATIRDLPLIDTGLLLRSVGFRISKETG